MGCSGGAVREPGCPSRLLGWEFGHMKVYSCNWQGLILLALALRTEGCDPLGILYASIYILI